MPLDDLSPRCRLYLWRPAEKIGGKTFHPDRVVGLLLPQLLCENAHRALFSKGRLLLRGHAEERETINRPAFYADGNKIKALVCSLFVPSVQKHTETH